MAEASVTGIAEPARLLLIDGEGGLADRLAGPLASEFVAPPMVVSLDAGRPALELLRGSAFDGLVIELEALSDLSDEMEDCVARVARVAAGALIVVLAADASISNAMAAMRAGAHDCINRATKPLQLVTRIGELARRHGKSRIAVHRPALAIQSSDSQPQAAPPPTIPVMRDLVLPMWRQEQRIIEQAIESFAGNIALAAAALELSPSTIYRKRQAWAEMGGKRA